MAERTSSSYQLARQAAFRRFDGKVGLNDAYRIQVEQRLARDKQSKTERKQGWHPEAPGSKKK